jgi:hypothetical protein
MANNGLIIAGLLAIAGVALLASGKSSAAIERRIAPENRRGDLNDDGYIDAADVTLMEKAVLDPFSLTATQFERADLQGTGIISMTNVVLLENYIAGTINVFPVDA